MDRRRMTILDSQEYHRLINRIEELELEVEAADALADELQRHLDVEDSRDIADTWEGVKRLLPAYLATRHHGTGG